MSHLANTSPQRPSRYHDVEMLLTFIRICVQFLFFANKHCNDMNLSSSHTNHKTGGLWLLSRISSSLSVRAFSQNTQLWKKQDWIPTTKTGITDGHTNWQVDRRAPCFSRLRENKTNYSATDACFWRYWRKWVTNGLTDLQMDGGTGASSYRFA